MKDYVCQEETLTNIFKKEKIKLLSPYTNKKLNLGGTNRSLFTY